MLENTDDFSATMAKFKKANALVTLRYTVFSSLSTAKWHHRSVTAHCIAEPHKESNYEWATEI